MALQTEMVTSLYELKTARAELESQVKTIKAQEDALRAQILSELDMAGLDSAKLGGFTVARTKGVRLEIASHETFQQVMLDRMNTARSEGRPLQDALLLQRTVAKTATLALLRSQLGLSDNDELDAASTDAQAAAAAMGLRLVPLVDLSVRKARS